MVDSVQGAAAVLRALQVACEPYNKLPDVQHVRFARADHGLLFRPYSLELVADDTCPARFYIVTQTHVVYVDSAEGTAEVICGIEEWCRQAVQFDALQKLDTFAHYLVRKALGTWLARVRERRLRRARTLLVKHMQHLALQGSEHDV